MDLNYLKKLLKIFDESGATELAIEEEGISLKVVRKVSENGLQVSPVPAYSYQPPAVSQLAPTQTVTAALPTAPEAAIPATPATSNLHEVKSPIVGTFYLAPSPESEPFVTVGSHVNPGSTLCIVEAMKLMNEIECDIAGTVEKILIENAKPVEYGQPLFLIRPD